MKKTELEKLRTELTTEYISKANELSRLNDRIEYCRLKIAELEVTGESE